MQTAQQLFAPYVWTVLSAAIGQVVWSQGTTNTGVTTTGAQIPESVAIQDVYAKDIAVPSYISAQGLLDGAVQFNRAQQKNLSDNERQLYEELRTDVVFAFTDSPSFTIGETAPGKLRIASANQDLGQIRVTLQATGAACFALGGKDLCKTPVSLVVDPYRE